MDADDLLDETDVALLAQLADIGDLVDPVPPGLADEVRFEQ